MLLLLLLIQFVTLLPPFRMMCVWERVDVVVVAVVVTDAPSREIAIESYENNSKREGGEKRENEQRIDKKDRLTN